MRIGHSSAVDGQQKDHEGILVSRDRVEGESGLRVRITRTFDDRELPVVVAAGVDDPCTAVRDRPNNPID